MGGMYVFPGGKLDEEDSGEALLSRMGNVTPADCRRSLDETPKRDLTAEAAAALFIASIREVFEEAGVLLARRVGEDHYVRLDDEKVQQRFSEWRLKLRSGEADFAQILESEDLELAVDNLAYFAHWLTPSRERRRYDTRFFVAYQPEGQEPVIDDHEIVDGVWRSPQEAIADYRRGDIALAPPTLRILEDLGSQSSIEALMDWANERQVWPIMPRVGAVDQKIAILLPWDPAFASTEGEMLEGLPEPHPMAEGPSRVVLEGEQWFSRGQFVAD